MMHTPGYPCQQGCAEWRSLNERIAVAEKIMAEQNAALAKAHAALVVAFKYMDGEPGDLQILEAINTIVGDK